MRRLASLDRVWALALGRRRGSCRLEVLRVWALVGHLALVVLVGLVAVDEAGLGTGLRG